MIKSTHHPKYKALIDWLIAARTTQGLTVRQLAEMIDEDFPLITKIETRVLSLVFFDFLIKDI